MHKKRTTQIKDYIKQLARYLWKRLKALDGTPHSIAAGIASGIAISFTPFVGLHMVMAAIIAWLLRGNIVASALGTTFGNPWTFPFIWVTVLFTGRHILGGDYLNGDKIEFIPFFEKSTRALMTLDFRLFVADVWPILWPMIVGCIPFVLAVWLVSYYLLKSVLIKMGKRSK